MAEIGAQQASLGVVQSCFHTAVDSPYCSFDMAALGSPIVMLDGLGIVPLVPPLDWNKQLDDVYFDACYDVVDNSGFVVSVDCSIPSYCCLNWDHCHDSFHVAVYLFLSSVSVLLPFLVHRH